MDYIKKYNEEERIRKEIRNFLIDMECKKEWIAYMEKQKENQWSDGEKVDHSSVDWDMLRREAAKDILCAILNGRSSADPYHVRIAIEITDELIKQLKEEER